MTSFYAVCFGFVASFNVILVVVHIVGRMKIAIENDVFGKRDYLIACLTVLMMVFNILFILYPFFLNSDISLLDTNTQLNCNIYVAIMQCLFLFSI